MHISSVTIEGFGSFKRSQTIRFNHKNIVALVGQNGSGKSTILQAIAFVLCRSNNFNASIITGDDDRANVSVVMCNEAEQSVQLGRELRKDDKEFFFIQEIKTKKHYYEYILYSMGFINDTSFFLLDTKCLESFTTASENDLCSRILQFGGIGEISNRSNDSDVSEKLIANTKQGISTQLTLQKHDHELILKQVQNFSDYERITDKKERFELYLKGFTKLASLPQVLSDDADIMKLREFADDYEKRIHALQLAKRDFITGVCSDEQSKGGLDGCNEVTSYMQSGLVVPDQSDGSNDTSLIQDTASHNEEALKPESFHDKQAQLIYGWCIEIFRDIELGPMFPFYNDMDCEYLGRLIETLLQKANEEVDVVDMLLSSKNLDYEQQENSIEQNRLQTCDSPIEQQESLDEYVSTMDQSSFMDCQNLIDNIDIAFKALAKSFYPVSDFVKENGIDQKDYLGPLALLINTDLNPRLHSTAVRLHPEYMFAHVVSSSRIADKIISGVSGTDKYQAEEFELRFIVLNEFNQDLSEYQRVSRFTKQANNKIIKEARRDGCEVVDILSVPNNLNDVAISLGDNVRYRYLVQPLLEYFETTVSKLKYVYQKLFGEYAVSFDRNELIRINETRRISGITPDGRELINSKTTFYEYASRFELIAVVNLHNIVISLLHDEPMQSTVSITTDAQIETTTADGEICNDHISKLQNEVEFLKRVRDNLAHPGFPNFREIVGAARYDMISNTYSSRLGQRYVSTSFTDSQDVSCTGNESLDSCDDDIITQDSPLNHDEVFKTNTDSHCEEKSTREKLLGINVDIRNEESKHIEVVSRIEEINDILMECKSLDAAIQRRGSEVEDRCSQIWTKCCEFLFAPNKTNNSQNAEKIRDITLSAMEGLRFTQEAFEDINAQLEPLRDIIDTEFPGHSNSYHQDLYEKYIFRLDSIHEYLESDWMVDYANMKLVQSIKSRKEIFFATLQSNFEIIFVKLTGIAGSLKLKRNTENEIVGISFDVSPQKVIDTVDLPILSINQQLLDEQNAYHTSLSRRGVRYRRSHKRNKRKRTTRQNFMRYLPRPLMEKLDNAINKRTEAKSDNKQGQNQGHSKEYSIMSSADDILEKENVENTSVHEIPQLAGSNVIFPDDSSDRDYEPYTENHNGQGKSNNMGKRHELIDLPDVDFNGNRSAVALSYEQKQAASLALLLSLHINHSFKVFLLDEIDAELDPILRVRLANTIKELSITYKNQYIISTHFRTILNVADKFYNVSRVRMYSGENGTTSVAQRISKEGALVINKDESLTLCQKST